MGTSQSSGGPGSGVPMVPAWVADPPAGEPMSPEDPALQKAAEEPNGPEAVGAPRHLPFRFPLLHRHVFAVLVVRLAILLEPPSPMICAEVLAITFEPGTAARKQPLDHGRDCIHCGGFARRLIEHCCRAAFRPRQPTRPCPARRPICPGGNGCGRRSGAADRWHTRR